MNRVVGDHNILFVTFDCLRHDVAQNTLRNGRTPVLRSLLPGAWQPRETPGTFTLPAHLAFFHGFLPTPLSAEQHTRLFALEFEGSLSTGPETYVFPDVDNILAGFVSLGYRTFCVGGVGFFNRKNPLGHVLPSFFQESVWSRELSVTAQDSAHNQVRVATNWVNSLGNERFLLFINLSATHPPHAHYHPGATRDCCESQMAALAYIDSQLPELITAVKRRGPCFCLFMGDHGEAYGEDGRWGHRIAHPTVTTVPYADFVLE